MFKSIFAFIKSLFSSVEDLTGVLDNATDFALLHTEVWVKEAYAENKAKSEELAIDEAEMQAKIKGLRKSQK